LYPVPVPVPVPISSTRMPSVTSSASSMRIMRSGLAELATAACVPRSAKSATWVTIVVLEYTNFSQRATLSSSRGSCLVQRRDRPA
jgi:hypothetical protein